MEKLIESPFNNETETIEVNGLIIENREDRISFYGELMIGKDRRGLQQAEKLLELFTDMVQVLKSTPLPESVAIEAAEEVANPFFKGM